MADDKPFEATAQRLTRARHEGDGPRSSDLNALGSLAFGSAATFAILPYLGAAARVGFWDAARGETNPWPYLVLAGGGVVVCVAGASGAVAATYLQARGFAFKLPSPNLKKLDPIAGARKLVSRDACVTASKAVVVTAALGLALAPGLRDAFGANTNASSASELAAHTLGSLRGAFATAILIAALFAVLDVWLERTKWKKRLRMSFDEMKRENRQSEGDPHLKGKRRAAQRAFARGSIARVRDAAFVVANPTHVAIALEYAPPAVAVPRVLVRAIDEGAREVKRRAREFGIPIVENVALARALLAATDVGDYIPPAAYAPVAAIVAALASEKALVR